MAADQFIVGVLGDFGASARELDDRRFVNIDRDSFDAAMRSLGVSFAATVPRKNAERAGTSELDVALRFTSLDDFRPERIVAQIPALAELLEARAEVPTTQTLERFGIAAAQRPTRPAPQRDAPSQPSGKAESVLDRILSQTEPTAPRRMPLDPALERLVRDVTEPALDRTDLDLLARWQDAVDHLLGQPLREILYHPRFQALEAAWRGLHALITATDGGPEQVIRVLDLPKVQLALDVARDESTLMRLVCDETETPGGVPYAALVADYTFGASELELTLLEVAGQIAARGRTTLIAGAQPSLLGLSDFRELGAADARSRIARAMQLSGWRELRGSEAARHVALGLPRVLLRLPYGPDTEPVGTFTFAERLTAADHGRFLWGGAALAIGRAVTAARGEPIENCRLPGFPLYVFREDAQPQALPPAETLMTESTIADLTDEGFTVLASIKDSDEVMVAGIRTISGEPVRVRSH